MIEAIQLTRVPRLQRKLSAIEKQALPKARVRALNRTASSVRTVTVRGVAKAMGTRQKNVRSRVKVLKATTGGEPAARISYKGKGLNMVEFRARQTKRGVSAAPWGSRKLFRHAFITEINGARIVMVRRKYGERMVGRLPIRAILGPGVAKTAMEPDVESAREAAIRERFPKELEHQLDYLVSRISRTR